MYGRSLQRQNQVVHLHEKMHLARLMGIFNSHSMTFTLEADQRSRRSISSDFNAILVTRVYDMPCFLVDIWMYFNLVDGRLDFAKLEDFVNIFNTKVGYANGSSQTLGL